MIQPLRTYHRRMFLVLAVALPAVFVAGLMARRKPTARAPGRIVVSLAVFTSDKGLADPNWRNHLFGFQTARASDGSVSARLLPLKPTPAPDVLVYYTDSFPWKGTLPNGARLLGRFDFSSFNSSYPLPSSNGFLVLYSPAQKSVLDFAPLGGRP